MHRPRKRSQLRIALEQLRRYHARLSEAIAALEAMIDSRAEVAQLMQPGTLAQLLAIDRQALQSVPPLLPALVMAA